MLSAENMLSAGELIFNEVYRRNLEGVVAKRKRERMQRSAAG
jgi:hypothetical protein